MSLWTRSTAEPKAEWLTSTPGLVETWPVQPARQVIPDWFKRSERRVSPDMAHGGMAHGHPPAPPTTGKVTGPPTYWKEEKPTIRYCPGVIDVMRAGYIMRAWTDIEITTPEPPYGDNRDNYRPNTAMMPGEDGSKIGGFGHGLVQGYPLHEGEYGFSLKLDSPWTCKLPPGWSLLYLPIPYEEKKPWRIVPGLVDNDIFHIVNILAMWSHHGSYLIEAGTPLVWLLPVKREGFNFKTEIRYDPERTQVLRAVGKGGIGRAGARIIHNSYTLYRDKVRRERGER